jgi:hypothetical protein
MSRTRASSPFDIERLMLGWDALPDVAQAALRAYVSERKLVSAINDERPPV